MAVALEGFSIRGYTSKMRALDVAKCWPFDEVKREVVEALLPPITVQKFSWWSDEVEVARLSCADGEGRPESSKASELENLSEVEEVEREGVDAAKGVVELEEEKLGLSCQVCRVFGAATVKAVNAHVDSCLAHASREEKRQMKAKAKARTPKKRSIVEIFAVAPQVERVDDDDDEDEDEYGSDNNSSQDDGFHHLKLSALADVGLIRKRKKQKSKSKLKKDEAMATVNKLKMQKKLKQFNKKGKKNEKESINLSIRSIARKEKSHKFKLQSSVPTGNSNLPVYSKGLAKDILDAVSNHKKKPRLKCLAAEKKTKTVRTSKFIGKLQKPVFPVRGILKNHTKVVSGQNSTVIDLQESSPNLCGIQQSNRHVRFSGKDDILGSGRQSFPSLECSKLQNICSSFSDSITTSLAKEHLAGRGKTLAIVEVNGSDDDVSTSTENETEVQSVTGKQLFHLHQDVDAPNFLRPHMSCQEHLSERSVTANQFGLHSENLNFFEQGDRAASHDPLYACSSRFFSTPKEGYSSSVNTTVGGTISRASNTCGKFIDHVLDPSPRVATIRSMDHMKAFSQPQSSFFTDMNGNSKRRLPFSSQTTIENYNGHALQYQPFGHLSPKELMHGICSFPDWKQRAFMYEEKCKDEDFIGLPLNSQGELIQLNSSGKGGFNQLQRPSTVTGSSNSLAVQNNILPNRACDHLTFNSYDGRAPPKDQLKLFPVPDCGKENPSLCLSSRSGITDLQGTGRTNGPFLDSVKGNNLSAFPVESDLGMMHVPYPGCKQYDQVQKHPGVTKIHPWGNPDDISLHVTQPKMRLMGKEFTVGTSNKDLRGLEDGQVWTDKQIIAEHHPVNTPIDNSSVKKLFQQDLTIHAASGNVKENVACSSGVQISQASQSALLMKPPDTAFSHPSLNCQTNAVYQNRCHTINGNPISELHHYSPPAATPALFNRAPIFQEPFVGGYELLKVQSRVPIPASTPYNTFQHMSSNSAHLKNKQKLSHATKSAFKFPFLRPDCGEHIRPSLIHSSSKNLPPWLLNATKQKETLVGSCESYSDASGSLHPCTVSGANLQTIPSLCSTPEVSYPYSHLTSLSPLQNSFGPASLACSPLMPVHRGFIPPSVLNNRHGDMMRFKDRMKSRVCFKVSDLGKKNKKRPLVKLDDSTKPTKIPNLEIQEDSTCAVTALQVCSNFGGDVECSTEAFGLGSANEKANSVEYGQKGSQKDGVGVFPEMDSSKLDAMARSGPIKLTAGAKHILKPSQNLDQNNFKPTYSTIPFAAATSSGRASESEKRSAKIYRF